MSPYSDHLDQWDRRRELADPRPCTLPVKAPAGMLGAWVKPIPKPEPDLDALDDTLAAIHRGQR